MSSQRPEHIRAKWNCCVDCFSRQSLLQPKKSNLQGIRENQVHQRKQKIKGVKAAWIIHIFYMFYVGVIDVQTDLKFLTTVSQQLNFLTTVSQHHDKEEFILFLLCKHYSEIWYMFGSWAFFYRMVLTLWQFHPEIFPARISSKHTAGHIGTKKKN